MLTDYCVWFMIIDDYWWLLSNIEIKHVDFWVVYLRLSKEKGEHGENFSLFGISYVYIFSIF